MTVEAKPLTALRVMLDSGPCSIALSRIEHITGYASLSGTPDESFLGWLTFRGTLAPVFDFNRVVCDAATPATFGARILLVKAGRGPDEALMGLLASGATDTLPANHPDIRPLELDMYLPMLQALVPQAGHV